MKKMNKNKFIKNIILSFVVFVIIFVNAYPTLYIKTNTPPNLVFAGQASWFDPWDINLYTSVIRSGQINGLLLQNLYTSTPNKPILMYPLYALTGMMFKNVNPFLLFQIDAIIFGIILIIGIFYLLKYFLNNFSEKIVAVIGICLGGGLGFMTYPNIQSADLSMTSFTLQSAFQRGHEAIGLIAYISSLVFFYCLFTKEKRRKTLVAAGIISLVISLIFYPYYILSFALISGIFLFIKNKGVLELSPYVILLPFLIPALLIVILLYEQISQNPTFSGVLNQNLPTPNPLLILTGYGILSILFIYYLFFSKKTGGSIFLIVWIIVSIVLSYLPFGFARFFLRGLFFPLVIIGIMAINSAAKKLNLNKAVILIIFVIILVPSSLKITYARITATQKDTPWYYLSNDEYRGFEFLNGNTPNKSGVLALYRLGNMVPAFTHNCVYFGHFLQTPDANNKVENLYSFYSLQMPPQEAQRFLKENNINYVLYGKDERRLYKKPVDLNGYYTFLTPVFSSNDLTIFVTM